MLNAQNISHSYGSLHALEDISLEVKEGEFVSIVGPSGSGKTTLLKILGGLLNPSQGFLSVKGNSIDVAIKRRDFGFVFQNPVLLPWRTVLQNVELPLEIIGDRTPFAESEKLLELVEKDGRVFITGTMIADNQVALRACCVNHRTEKKHVENLIKVLRELGEKAYSSLRKEKILP